MPKQRFNPKFDPIVDDYDPTWLVELAKQQHPDIPQLAEELAKCKIVRYPHCIIDLNSTYGLTFSEKGDDEFIGHIFLFPGHGDTIILDPYTNYRIGHIEYLHDHDLRNSKGIVINIDNL